jgi:hypothetical protein
MQPAILQEKNPDIYRFDVRLLLQCIVGCIFYSVGLIIPRKSPCIYFFETDLQKCVEIIYFLNIVQVVVGVTFR